MSTDFYFVTTRPGSIIVDVGILLDILLIGVTGWDAVTRMIQLIRDRVPQGQHAIAERVVLLTNRTWRDVEGGRTREVEERILTSYLPSFPRRRLAPDDRSRLAGFLAFIRGVRRKQLTRELAEQARAAPSSVVGRPFSRATLERMLGVDLSSVSDDSVKQLSDLVKVARTAEFAAALRTTRRSARARRKSSEPQQV